MIARPRILIGFARSGRVRRAFQALGLDAWECDLLPSLDGGRHIQMDAYEAAIMPGWDFGIFHPECTYLTNSAEWAYSDPDFVRYPGAGYHQKVGPGTLTGRARREARERALDGILSLMSLPYPTAIENPRGAIGTAIRPPHQTIQPYQFGDDASKATCLWLNGVPRLVPTARVHGRLVEWPKGSGRMVERWGNQTDSGQNRLPPGAGRAAKGAETYPGVARAFAAQWGGYLFADAMI